MPIYTYGCKECQHEWEDQRSISTFDEPLKEPCPNCGKEGTVERLIGGEFLLGDPIKLGGKGRRPAQWLIDRISHIEKTHKATKKSRYT